MAGSERVYSIIISVLFILLISIVLLNQRLHFYTEKTVSVTENRNLAKKPVLNPDSLNLYPKQFEPYFNDHFPFRQEMMKEYTVFNYLIFKKSPHPELVEIGKNGWLFYVTKEKSIYKGEPVTDSDEIKNIVKFLKDMAEWHSQNGRKFYLSFFPMKAEIYPEFLPNDYRRGKNGTITDRIIELVKKEPSINFIDVKPALLKAKKENIPLYKFTDTHWNFHGAMIAYQEIIGRIKHDFPQTGYPAPEDVIFRRVKVPAGNLASISGLEDYFSDEEYTPQIRNAKAKLGKPEDYPVYNKKPNETVVVKKTGDNNLPKAVVIRDSFGEALMPFLDENFRKTTYIFDNWSYGRNEEVINYEKPDIVLLLIYEPHISNILFMN